MGPALLRTPTWKVKASQSGSFVGISQIEHLETDLGRGDDTVGNPRRAQISQYVFFELILLLKLDEQFPVEQFEARVSQSKAPSPPLMIACMLSPAGRFTKTGTGNEVLAAEDSGAARSVVSMMTCVLYPQEGTGTQDS